MNRAVVGLLPSLWSVAGCGNAAATPSPSAAGRGANHDCAFGLPGEWQVLFEGAATDALRGYGMDGFPADRWVVEAGELRTVPGSGIDVVTRDRFGDFELEFEWRVAPGGNSGVMYRVIETARACVDHGSRIPGPRRRAPSRRARADDVGRGALRPDRARRPTSASNRSAPSTAGGSSSATAVWSTG